MSKFIENVNQYLSIMKIKQSYLCRASGIEKNKMSRLLNGSQEETGTDMEKIARGLGKSVGYFLVDSINIPQIECFHKDQVAFYAGEPSSKQQAIAEQLIELMENIDEIMSAKQRFNNIAKD